MNSKKKWYAILGVVGIIIVGVGIFFLINIFPKLQLGKEISEILQPVLEAKNQSMHLEIVADLADESVNLDSDIYIITEDENQYMVMDQYDFPIYVVDNVLFLENGHAFKITEKKQSQEISYKDLFLQIAAAYEVFDITSEKTDSETIYSVNVTGEQIQKLLAMVMPMEDAQLEAIDSLQLKMFAQGDELDRIEMFGQADVNGTEVKIEVSLSDFEILEAGEYVIPDLIKEAVESVDEDSLFNITEDSYRLFLAFQQFSNKENDGTVTIRANCGIINFKNTYDLKEFVNTENASIDAENIEELPAMIAFLCMEGEISCTETDTGYEYKLALDEESMQKIAEMIVPELVNYVINMNEGTGVITLENDKITAIEISVEGSINALFTEIPAEVGVVFEY